jgi:N-acetylglutamate synthase-like GNAT family acetyltransferase
MCTCVRNTGAYLSRIRQDGDDHYQRQCSVILDYDQVIAGGVFSEMFWDWLHIDLLWLIEELRAQGYVHQLLTRMEDEARQRDARHVYLDTYSFQTPEFYTKYGYRFFGEL